MAPEWTDGWRRAEGGRNEARDVVGFRIRKGVISNRGTGGKAQGRLRLASPWEGWQRRELARGGHWTCAQLGHLGAQVPPQEVPSRQHPASTGFSVKGSTPQNVFRGSCRVARAGVRARGWASPPRQTLPFEAVEAWRLRGSTGSADTKRPSLCLQTTQALTACPLPRRFWAEPSCTDQHPPRWVPGDPSPGPTRRLAAPDDVSCSAHKADA